MDKGQPPKKGINFAPGKETQMVADARGDRAYGQQVYGFQVNKSPHAFILRFFEISDNVEDDENDDDYENRLPEAREPS